MTYQQMCVPSETKRINVKVFNITRINEAKTLAKDLSCHCKCKFDSTESTSNQNWNNEIC